MNEHLNENKTILIKIIMAVLNLKASEIAKITNTSCTSVSRYISGERDCIYVDLFFIEKCFNIKVKEYSYVNEADD